MIVLNNCDQKKSANKKIDRCFKESIFPDFALVRHKCWCSFVGIGKNQCFAFWSPKHRHLGPANQELMHICKQIPVFRSVLVFASKPSPRNDPPVCCCFFGTEVSGSDWYGWRWQRAPPGRLRRRTTGTRPSPIQVIECLLSGFLVELKIQKKILFSNDCVNGILFFYCSSKKILRPQRIQRDLVSYLKFRSRIIKFDISQTSIPDSGRILESAIISQKNTTAPWEEEGESARHQSSTLG